MGPMPPRVHSIISQKGVICVKNLSKLTVEEAIKIHKAGFDILCKDGKVQGITKRSKRKNPDCNDSSNK